MVSITEDWGDPSTRKIVVGKDCYLKYCVECPFKIDAFWEKKEGFKYGWMGIICCANGGVSSQQPMCPFGVGWDIALGRCAEFDPDNAYELVKPIGYMEGYQDTKPPDDRWRDDD